MIFENRQNNKFILEASLLSLTGALSSKLDQCQRVIIVAYVTLMNRRHKFNSEKEITHLFQCKKIKFRKRLLRSP